MKQLLKIFFLWRIWLLFVIFLAIIFLPVRPNQLFTTIRLDHQVSGIMSQEWVYVWSNFDGVHYLNISQRGYINEGRFLPLYPLLIKFISAPLTIIWGANIAIYFWTSQVLQLLLGFLSLTYLYKLLRLDFSQKISTRATILFLSFPLTFFIAATYSEALFILLSVLALYFARKQKWFYACLAASLLSITRLSGLLIVLPLVIEFFFQNRSQLTTRKIFSKLSPFLLVPIPLLLYAYYNFLTWGDWLYFVHAHGSLGNSRAVSTLVFPLVTVYRYIQIFFTVSPQLYEFWIAVLELISLLYAAAFICWGYLKKIRVSYQVYSVVIIALPLLSGTLSGFPRYIIPIFPIFLVQALLLEKRPRLYKVTVFFMLLLQAVLFSFFARSYYIS